MFWKRKRECNHTSYNFEADFMSDPIWCNDCDGGLLNKIAELAMDPSQEFTK